LFQAATIDNCTAAGEWIFDQEYRIRLCARRGYCTGAAVAYYCLD